MRKPSHRPPPEFVAYIVDAIENAPGVDSEIRQLIATLRGAGLVNAGYVNADYRPHVSLSVHRAIDERFAVEAVAALSERHAPIQVTFPYVGIFNGVPGALFLGINAVGPLREIHDDLAGRLFDAGVACWDYYVPEHWIPHCALLVDEDRSRLVSGLSLVSQRVPLAGTLDSIGVCGFRNSHEFRLRDSA